MLQLVILCCDGGLLPPFYPGVSDREVTEPPEPPCGFGLGFVHLPPWRWCAWSRSMSGRFQLNYRHRGVLSAVRHVRMSLGVTALPAALARRGARTSVAVVTRARVARRVARTSPPFALSLLAFVVSLA